MSATLSRKTVTITIDSQAGVRWLVTDEQLKRKLLRHAETVCDIATDGLLPVVNVSLVNSPVADTLSRWFCPKCQRLWMAKTVHAGDGSEQCPGLPEQMQEVKPSGQKPVWVCSCGTELFDHHDD